MKKFRFFSFASAMLLASAAGMVSCSSDSIEPTGGSGVTGQVVKTQFAINIPYGGNSSTNQAKKVTRMTDAITQQNNNFRGISDIVLLTFSGDPATTASITDATNIITIGTDDNAYAQDNYRRLYRDIEIPVGTSHIAFYGKATKNGESSFKTGEITDEGTSGRTLANISHKLTPINSDADFKTDEDAQAIIGALNDIANAKVNDGTDYTWANIGSVPVLPSWLTGHEQEFLANRYKAFIGLKAGSKTSVKACIESLMAALAGETPEAGVPDTKKLTAEIYKKCQEALNTINNLREFPRNLNLPDGVAALSWNTGESKFAYNNPGNDLFSAGNTINYKKICYPAELSYFVNTKTMVSDKDMSNLNEFPSYTDWTKNTGTAWTGKSFTEKAVESSTKTVGLKDPVQYSVAVLKSTVKCDAAKLEDNAKQAGKLEADQQITVPTNGFKVTGILIGGQPASVDWKYEPATTGETFANTIYDNVMNGGTLYAKNESTTPTTGNYTLVFDNKNAPNKVVFVTIELTNNSGMDFYGQDGIIPKDAKFYLVGKLNPAATSGTTNPLNVDRVFVQDYVTTANFNIKTLKDAYNCIPDLRTSGINVGLAVDLDWKSGITFDVEI